MGAELKCVKLRGVTAGLKNSLKLTESMYPGEIERIGTVVAGRLDFLVNFTHELGPDGIFDIYDYEVSYLDPGEDEEGNETFGLRLKCDDMYVDRIFFFRDKEDGCYGLAIGGCTNYNSELFNGWGSELYVFFKTIEDKLVFDDVIFCGLENHNMNSTSEFEISDKAKLKIMHIADRATNVFLRTNLLRDKFKNTSSL